MISLREGMLVLTATLFIAATDSPQAQAEDKSNADRHREMRLRLGLIAYMTCFSQATIAELEQRCLVRNPERVVVGCRIATRYPPDLMRVEKSFFENWNPVFANRTASWTQYMRFEMRSDKGDVFPHAEITQTWLRQTPADAKTGEVRLWGSEYLDNLVPTRLDLGGAVALSPARGGSFPDGKYTVLATYDTRQNRAGLHPLLLADRFPDIEIKKATTELEALEARYQDALVLDFVHGDREGALRILKEIVAKRPNSALPLGRIAGYCARLGRYEEALEWGRRYQEIYEKHLDSTFFTREQLRKAGLEERYDLSQSLKKWQAKLDESRGKR